MKVASEDIASLAAPRIPEHVFSYAGFVAHGLTHRSPEDIDAHFAAVIADTMQALAAPSRVRILGRLHAGPCAVNELALLRHLGLVVGRRDGRRVVYDLYDDHVGELLEQAISHVEHVRAGLARTTPGVALAEA
jgi:DNA-binding transcriptional ArsR family regulator